MSSVRERAEWKASETEDKIVKLDPRRSMNMTHEVTFNRSLRDAAARAEYLRQEQASPATAKSENAKRWLEMNARWDAERKADEAEQIRTGKLIILG